VEDEGRLRPLPTALRVAAVRPAADVALASGTRSLVGLFDRLPVAVVAPKEWHVLDPAGDSLRDVDTRDDLPSHPDDEAAPRRPTTPPEGGPP
jgi:molybdopterin-guanine dinucleotide biosynthesis protein A